MANKKQTSNGDGGSETPSDFPSVTPRDLYPTSDIRFVLVEIGKLSSSVERLIVDVKSQSDKLDVVRHQVTFVRGAMWVIGGLIALSAIAVKFF